MNKGMEKQINKLIAAELQIINCHSSFLGLIWEKYNWFVLMEKGLASGGLGAFQL